MSNMDERTMIREQERLAKEAKLKKTKKYKIIAGAVVSVALVGGIWYAGWGRTLLAQQTVAEVKVQKTASQEIVIAQVKSIYGNELTYTVAEKVEREETPTQGDNAESSDGSVPNFNRGGGEMPDRGEFQGGFPGGGEMPDMGSFPGGGEMPDMSGFSGGGSNGGNRGNSTGAAQATNQITYENETYRLGAETVTTYIPVGTDVVTKLGTITTFSRLAAGDYVALVVDKENGENVIVSVYIIG